MARTTHSIVRRAFHLLPFLLWSIVTAAAIQRSPEYNGLTNKFVTGSTSAPMTFEYSLGMLGLTGVIFVGVSSLVHAVVKSLDAENTDRELV